MVSSLRSCILFTSVFVMYTLNSSVFARTVVDLNKNFYQVTSTSNIGANNPMEEDKTIEFEIILAEDGKIEAIEENVVYFPKEDRRSIQDIPKSTQEHQISGTQKIKSIKDKNPNRKSSCVGPVTLMARCF